MQGLGMSDFYNDSNVYLEDNSMIETITHEGRS